MPCAQAVGHRQAAAARAFQLRQARQFQRIVKGLAHRGRGYRKTPCIPASSARSVMRPAPPPPDAAGFQFVDHGARIFLGGVGALGDVQPNICWNSASAGILLVGDQPDARAIWRARASACITSKPLARATTTGTGRRLFR
jgi:hypothetical protein